MLRVGPLVLLSVAVAPLSASVTSRPASLEAECPVAWRGVSLAEALGELAGRLTVPYALDASVDSQVLKRRVRMSAGHLTGAEAFRWAARLGGLEAVLVDGTFLVAVQDRVPVVWRARGRAVAGGRDDPRWLQAVQRRAAIQWVDAPLSGVAADVSAAFGLDVVFDPGLLEEPRLVCLEGSELGLDRVLEALAGQLGVESSLVDGALWVRPAGAAAGGPVTSRPAAVRLPRGASAWGTTATGGISGWIRLDRSIGTWQALAARIEAATGLSCRLAGVFAGAYPVLEAEGPVRDTLEAAQLLGWVSWRVEDGAQGDRPLLQVEVRRR